RGGGDDAGDDAAGAVRRGQGGEHGPAAEAGRRSDRNSAELRRRGHRGGGEGGGRERGQPGGQGGHQGRRPDRQGGGQAGQGPERLHANAANAEARRGDRGRGDAQGQGGQAVDQAGVTGAGSPKRKRGSLRKSDAPARDTGPLPLAGVTRI